MPFSPKLLNENEDIVLDLHPHWIYFVKSTIAFVLAVALGVLLLAWGWEGITLAGSGVLILVALLWYAWTYITWVTTNFVITTDRIIYRRGVLSKHGIEIPLERVNTVFFSQRILERIVGSGDLVIESAGSAAERSSRTCASRLPSRTRSTCRWRRTRTASSTA